MHGSRRLISIRDPNIDNGILTVNPHACFSMSPLSLVLTGAGIRDGVAEELGWLSGLALTALTLRVIVPSDMISEIIFLCWAVMLPPFWHDLGMGKSEVSTTTVPLFRKIQRRHCRLHRNPILKTPIHQVCCHRCWRGWLTNMDLSCNLLLWCILHKVCCL